ncbi:MAG TPA: cation diffusion facilitator family transporter [Longimicrobiaceae bacterium]|nr:cation diffusion facilitator family transporter [Longimicrobiaceae bacterium]
MHPSLIRYGLIAVAAALATIGLKGGAYWVTGSVALLSDALESMVNLVTSLIALAVLAIAARPADEEHAYGHTKAEYFASGFEGALILLAAGTIAIASVRRLVDPIELSAVGTGLVITAVATAINFFAARYLLSAGLRFGSIALESGARHLMVDVWTSLAVIVAVATASGTGWLRLDPIVALLVAINIVRTGIDLLRRSLMGLLDTALPEETRREIDRILKECRPPEVEYHALRTRQAGTWAFVSLHVLVPGRWSVQEGHDLLEEIERRIREAVPNSTVFTHLEPIEDPVSFEDTELRRKEGST